MRFARIAACLALIVVSLIPVGCVTNKTQMAIDGLLEEVKRNPDNPDLHARLAQSYLVRHDETRNPGFLYVAANELKEVIRLKPELHWGHCALGLVYQIQGKDDLALFETKEAVRLDPECPRSRSSLGMLYAKKGYSEETCYDEEMNDLAAKELKEAIRLNPDGNSLHAWLGAVYARKGLYDLSVFERTEALKLFESPQNRQALGFAYFLLGDFEQAVNEYKEALQLNPKFVNFHLNIAWVYFVTNRYEDSLAEIRNYQKSNRWPLPPDSAINRYVSMRQTGENTQAQRMFEEYVTGFKGKGWESDLLQYYSGKISDADLLKKPRHRCDLAVALYFVGYDRFLKGDRQTAAEYLQKALDTNIFGSGSYRGASTMLEKLQKEGAAGMTEKVGPKQ